MAGRILRGAIVGASTLLGKELAEELNRAKTVVWDLNLFDAEDAGGQITAAGDEALVIQPTSAEAFAGIDVAFFAGDAATALEFWKIAHAAGASIVDLTGALERQPQVLVRSPFVKGGAPPDLTTVAVVSAHPAAIMLSLADARLLPLGLIRMAATVLQPASEFGTAGVEEVHQQTVGLLSFKPLKKDLYDAQVAFNVVASLGDAAKVDLETVRTRISCHIGVLTGAATLDPIALQLLQVPVFHGYTASVFLEFPPGVTEEAVRSALNGGELQFVEEQSPSNESVAGKGEVLLSLIATNSKEGSAFWLWMAADNLRLAARNASACALELTQLRPASGVKTSGVN
jgi:aspartate-semialdehyde dehydrogenase